MSLCIDSKNLAIRNLGYKNHPFNAYGDLKDGFYSYSHAVTHCDHPGSVMFIEDVQASKINDRSNKNNNPDLYLVSSTSRLVVEISKKLKKYFLIEKPNVILYKHNTYNYRRHKKMAVHRNRVIYQSEALFISPDATGYHYTGALGTVASSQGNVTANFGLMTIPNRRTTSNWWG